MGFSIRSCLGAIATAAVLWPQPAPSAERIQFFYGPLEITVAVAELEAIAAGRPSQGFLSRQLSAEQRQALRTALTYRLDMDLVTVSQVSGDAVGTDLLQRIGTVVQTDSLLNGSKALHAALIAAAAEADLSLLNLIRQFPLDTIQLDLVRVLQLVAESERIFQQQRQVVADIQRQAAAQPAPAPAPAPAAATPHDWRLETFTFQTPGRSAPSPADVYLPVGAAAPPVVVISHGVASSRSSLGYLATHLAAHGYAVVVPEHIDSSTDRFSQFLSGLAGPPQPASLHHRPQDITAALDWLEQRAAAEWGIELNLQAVGVLGQSLGGYTALAAAGAELTLEGHEDACSGPAAEQPPLNLSLLLQCRFPAASPSSLADERVQAVLAINPLTRHLFGPSGLQQLTVPTLLVASTEDYFVPALVEQIEPFQWVGAEQKYLVLVENGTHFTALENDPAGLPVPSTLIGPDPALAQPPLQALTLAFFDRHLRQLPGRDYALSQPHLASFNSEALQFTILRNSADFEL